MQLKKNIFLTGAPSSGKTTVIKKVMSRLGSMGIPLRRFYTEEERHDGRRTGFLMHAIDGRSGYLAREGIASAHRIRRFGVDLEALGSGCVVVGTVMLGGGDFISAVKSRDEIEIIEVLPQ